MRILLVEDDSGLSNVLAKTLKREGYTTDIANSLSFAETAIEIQKYDLIILDRMLPDGDGLDLITSARNRNVSSRYIVLSALNDIHHKVTGLDVGADDYVTKPYDPEELVARIRVALRRPIQRELSEIHVANLKYNMDSRDIDVNGQNVILPRLEKIAFELLLKRFNKVVSREALEQAMYNFDSEIQSNSLESHISKLRKNLAKFGADLKIHTMRGIGYVLRETKQ